MSQVTQWVRIERGLAVYREAPGGTFLLDDTRGERRRRMSLHTGKLSKAIAEVERICFPVEVKSIEEVNLTDSYFELSALKSANASAPAAILKRLEEIESLVKPPEKVLPSVLIEDAIKKHVARVAGGESDSEKYQRQIPGIIRRLAEQAKVTHLDGITDQIIDTHAEWLKTPTAKGGAGLAEKTRINVKGVLKDFFRFATEQGWYEKDPAGHLKLGKASRQAILFYLAWEIDKVIQTALKEKKYDLAAVFGIAVFAGPRLEEIHTIERDRIHLETRKLEIFDLKRKDYKIVPIFDPLLPILRQFLISCGKRTKPFAELRSLGAYGDSMSRLVKRSLPDRKAVLHDAGGARLNSMLMARRAFSTHMRALGVSDRKTAQWSGHDAALDSSRYCGEIPDGERPYDIRFLGKKLVTEGLPCPFPEPGSMAK